MFTDLELVWMNTDLFLFDSNRSEEFQKYVSFCEWYLLCNDEDSKQREDIFIAVP